MVLNSQDFLSLTLLHLLRIYLMEVNMMPLHETIWGDLSIKG